MDVFLQQIVALCRQERTTAKWVLFRDLRQAHTVAERVVRDGTDWVNLRCETLYRLALDVAAPFLLEAGVDPRPEGLGPALALRLLEDLPDRVPRHFRPLAEQPRIGETLWRTLFEIRMAGLRAADLPGSNARLLEFRALVHAYEEHLAEHRVADRAAIFHEALRRVQHVGIGPADLVLPVPDPHWSGLERRLLEALPGRRLEPHVLDLPGLEAPRRLPAARRVAPPAATDAERLAWASAPAEAPPAFGDGTLDLFMAGGREAELEEVLRRILSDRLPLDEVEISLANADLAPLVWEKLERHELPGSFETGVPALLTRPGRGLAGFLAWVEGGFVAYDLRRWLLSGTVRGAADGARLLERSVPTWGRETYARSFEAEIGRLEKVLQDPNTSLERRESTTGQIGRLRELGVWVQALLARVPEGEQVGLAAWCEACRHVLEEVVPVASELDAKARARILLALGELRQLGDQRRPLGEAVRMVRERLEALAVARSRSASGALHVTMLGEAAWSGRPHLFVLGLEEGHFRSGAEDPVLFDEERAALADSLATSSDRVTESVWAGMTRLAAASGRVTLSFSCRNLREGRLTPPSWPFVHAARLLDPGIQSHGALYDSLGNPRSVVPESPFDALAPADWWLAALRARGPAGLPRVRERFLDLDRGLEAEIQRAGKGLTEFTGVVPSAAGRYDPRGSEVTVSASRLETLGACPFRYFLQYVLRLQPLEIGRPEPERWLDPRSRGSALHGVFADYYRELRARGSRPAAQDARRLQELLARRLETLRDEIPPVSEQVYEHERHALAADVQRFLDLELLSRRDSVPVALEVSFAMPEPEGEALDQEQPVLLQLPGQRPLRLRGRIDRIDRRPDGSYLVVDYKTGSDYDAQKRYAGGRRLQFALYALAARELLQKAQTEPVRVVGSAYYHPTDRARQHWHWQKAPEPSEVADVLEDLLYPLRSGIFVQTDQESDCAWCDFRAVCGDKPYERARLKKGEAPDRLGRMRQHE